MTGRTPHEPKTPYRQLTNPLPTILIALLAGSASWLVMQKVSPVLWPVWAVMVTFGLWQAGFDAGTTWIPKRVAHATWWVLAVAVVAVGAMSPSTGALTLVSSLLCVAAFWAVWALTGAGFGFGDVRFAPLVGAVSGALWGGAGLALVVAAGLVLTLAWMVTDRALSGQRRLVPWVPGLWAGCVMTLLLL
ncbi:hypothetical protein [Luteococcus sp.]|uniref:hypothetical protein n=1 Tax=Luteococcus sp. TaxID=1969402 RepID=UPI003735288C